MVRHRRAAVRLLLFGSIAWMVGSIQAATLESRFHETGELGTGPAAWVSLDGDRIAFGAGRSLRLAQAGLAPALTASGELDSAVASAVLVRDRLYAAGTGSRLAVVALGGPARHPEPVRLEPRVHGQVRLGRMDDYLLVAEDGFGLRVLDLALHGSHHGPRRSPAEVAPVGVLSLDAGFRAVTSSSRRVYLATDDGSLLIVDASDPRRPLLAGEIEIDFAVRDLAANGDTVYLIDGERLLVRDLSTGTVFESELPAAHALAVAGRTLHVATEERGLVTLRDGSATAALVTVTVANNVFSPREISINAGDTVRWSKQTTGLHNVQSCSGDFDDPSFCTGRVSPDGGWGSGSPTTAPFVFEHVFQNTGEHGYFCIVHAAFGMTGTVNVAAPAPMPPAVPNGVSGAPLRVGKNDATGNLLSVSWDTTTCQGAADHHLVFGGGSQLPAVPGGSFGVAGARCDVGTSSPFVWDSPATTLDPSGLVWFLMVADDDSTTEGSWGRDSSSAERTGPGAGGSSGQCGITAKDLANSCGQ